MGDEGCDDAFQLRLASSSPKLRKHRKSRVVGDMEHEFLFTEYVYWKEEFRA